MPWWDTVDARGRAKVAVDRLSFDRSNPRFTPEKQPENASEVATIAQLQKSADLGELVQSISASGYVDIEPLIVIGDGESLVVLEGNRRLAALKVLTISALAAEARVSVPDLTQAVRDTLNEVSVYRVLQREEARDLIGFKHINGPQAWDAYAKARYAANWLDAERAKREAGSDGLTLSEISHRMGDKHDTIYRTVSAVYVLDQAQDRGLYSVADRSKKSFSFSHLYTALAYPEYRDFLGMPQADRTEDPPRNPIDDAHTDNLQQLLVWLYGSKSNGIEPAISTQNPDLARLRRVLGDPRSRRVMLERNNLSEAVDSTVTPTDRFEKSLIDADENLKKAQAAIHGYDGSDETLFVIGRDVAEKGRVILRNMAAAREDFLAGTNSSGK